MSKLNKAEIPFTEKLKQWFKNPKAVATCAPHLEEIILSRELLADLDETCSVQDRLRILKDLKESVRHRRLQEHGVELLFMKTKDLLLNESPNVRHSVIYFYEALVVGQFERLGIMRATFFNVVKKSKEDLVPLLSLLDALTQKGKDILYFEDELGPFIRQILPLMTPQSGPTLCFLQMTVNLFRYNAAYLDSDVVYLIISYIRHLCPVTNDSEETIVSLQIFDAIICYSYIPKNALHIFISTLCRVVNMEIFSKDAWRITRRLMGTHLGHSALYCLSMLVQVSENQDDVALLRGAIFFIGFSLWSPNRIKSLEYSAVTILPTFIHALRCKHHLVIHEVMQQIERLVMTFGQELHAAACDAVVEILELLLDGIQHLETSLKSNIEKRLHDVITFLENLSEEKRYNGSKHKLFAILDLCANDRPESSVIRLIEFRYNSIHAAKPNWIKLSYDLIDRYYRQETRVNIRLKTLDVLLQIVKSNHYSFEEELIDKIVIVFLGQAHQEPEARVRKRVIEVLTTLCSMCITNKNLDLLNVLHTVIKRPLDPDVVDQAALEAALNDVSIAVKGLIKVFKDKLRQLPSPFILRVLGVLTSHLEKHYEYPQVFATKSEIRYHIFRLFLSLRAEDGTYHLGIAEDDDSVYYSPYIICRNPEEELEAEILWNKQHSTSPPTSPLSLHGPTLPSSSSSSKQNTLWISLNKACLLVIVCLERETDWNVLCLVLTRVPMVLQNKALICRYGKSINKFVTPLVFLTDKNCPYPAHLSNTPSKFSKSDFHNHIFPVLAALASYNEFLESTSQTALIRSLELGLLSRECNRMCIVALTASALEMKRSMYHIIPEVLLNFSKISATKSISTPILEFLSTMVRLPEVFSSFTDTNYITVFAIALPFTNPFRFDAYTVSLAHHVIVMWFLKCRLAYRQNFVQFIITGLNSNVIVPFEDNDRNKDSSGRVRSTSLSASARPVEAKSSTVGRGAQQNQIAFHQELTETSLDILARYMYGNVSVKTRRLKTAEFILKSGHSATWLIGTMLVTVSTSCCTHIAMRGGLCDRCYFYCIKEGKSSEQQHHNQQQHHQQQQQQQASNRRRHVSDINAMSSRYLTGGGGGKGIESDLRRQMSVDRMESSTNEDRKEIARKLLPQTCNCWCSGWAEIYIRRPSGDVSWMCRVQNTQLLGAHAPSTNLYELTALFNSVLNPDGTNKDANLNQDDKIQVDQLSEEEYNRQCEVMHNRISSERMESNDESAISKSPVKKTKSYPVEASDDNDSSKRNSCDPIPEVEEDTRSIELRRRQSDTWRKSLPPDGNENSSSAGPYSPQSSHDSSNVNQPSMRTTRSHTISVTSPLNRLGGAVRRSTLESGSGFVRRPGAGGSGKSEKNDKVSGISPQFVFLMLYQSSTFGNVGSLDKPLLLPSNKITETSIKNLDRIPAHETHKIGVLYIGPNQINDEVGILRNISGSTRYAEFLNGLGNLIDIRDIDKSTHFIGGLDCSEGDGDFAYMWEDDVMQVIFHVATLMPNHDTDPQANKKKRHIGNDYVAIVYNDSGNRRESYKMGTVKGRFISACIVITPLDQGSNRVSVDCKPELREPLGHVMDPKIVSDKSLSILVRQWALHCNLAAQIQQSLSNTKPYSSNWLERLRAIKRLKEKLQRESQKEEEDRERGYNKPQLNDFTAYVIMRKKKENGD